MNKSIPPTVAIAGSSPVSMLYALMLSEMQCRVSIFTGKIIGGAWHEKLQSDNYFTPTATHILMFSSGLNSLLRTIGFSAKKWTTPPKLIDLQGQSIGNFGSSEFGEFIGDLNGQNNFFSFLKDKVLSDPNITIHNTNISQIKINKSVSIFDKKSIFDNFDGLVLPNGVNCDLEIDEQKIAFLEKNFEVKTLEYVLVDNTIQSNSFVHISDKDSLIREMQLINYSNQIRIWGKISRNGNRSKLNSCHKELRYLCKKMWNVSPNEENSILHRYQNFRRSPKIEERKYSSIPLIIPGHLISKQNQNRIRAAQDLSQIFSNIELLKNEIYTKFF